MTWSVSIIAVNDRFGVDALRGRWIRTKMREGTREGTLLRPGLISF